MKPEELPVRTKLIQLAEEGAELSQAALKLVRSLDGDTPVPESQAKAHLLEEIADVMVCTFALIGQAERTEERTETHSCDLISRQAAVEAIENTDWYHLMDGVMVRGANSKEHQAWYKEQDIYKALEQLPSAQPEPSYEAIKEYCRKRCLSIVDTALLEKYLPSAQPERRWIPCSERMPEERQEILATTTDNAWGDVVIIRTYYKEMHKSVIAWMPLPEPYAERRTDEGD